MRAGWYLYRITRLGGFDIHYPALCNLSLIWRSYSEIYQFLAKYGLNRRNPINSGRVMTRMSKKHGEGPISCKAFVLFAFFCVVSIILGAQDSFCAARHEISTGDDEVRWLGMRHLDGGLELRYEKERNTEGGEGSQFITDRNTFEERVNLNSDGYIYHPNLMEYHSESSLGLREDFFGGSTGSTSSTSFLSEYNASATLLKEKKVSANLFASKFSIPVSSQFYDVINIDTSNYGGLLRYKNTFLPMTLLLRYENTKEDSIDFTRERTEQGAEWKATHRYRNFLNSEFRYEYKDLVESAPTSQEITSNTAYITSLLDREKLHGVSNISALQTSNIANITAPAQENTSLQASENYHYDHTKSFTSLYGYNFSRFTSGEFETLVNSGYLGVRHRLYESLETELATDLSQTNATEFTENYYGPRFLMNYHKKVPGGIFSAGYNFLYRHTDREAPSGIITVLNERITLTDPQRHFLANTNVSLGSVVVRDTSGLTLTEGVDYLLVQSGVLTEIQRVALPNGTVVVVEYVYSTPRSLVFDTLGNQVNLRYDFRRLLSVYYLYQSIEQIPTGSQTQTVDTSDTSQLSSTLRNIYGAETRWRWFTFTTEYEDDRSELAPFTSIRLRGSANFSPTERSNLAISASQSWTDYTKDVRSIEYFIAEAYYLYRFNSLIDLALSGGRITEKGTDQDTDIWRFRGELRSHYRTLELKLSTDYLTRTERQTNRDELLIKMSLIRRFNIF